MSSKHSLDGLAPAARPPRGLPLLTLPLSPRTSWLLTWQAPPPPTPRDPLLPLHLPMRPRPKLRPPQIILNRASLPPLFRASPWPTPRPSEQGATTPPVLLSALGPTRPPRLPRGLPRTPLTTCCLFTRCPHVPLGRRRPTLTSQGVYLLPRPLPFTPWLVFPPRQARAGVLDDARTTATPITINPAALPVHNPRVQGLVPHTLFLAAPAGAAAGAIWRLPVVVGAGVAPLAPLLGAPLGVGAVGVGPPPWTLPLPRRTAHPRRADMAGARLGPPPAPILDPRLLPSAAPRHMFLLALPRPADFWVARNPDGT